MGSNYSSVSVPLPETDWRIRCMSLQQRQLYYAHHKTNWVDAVDLFCYINLNHRTDRHEQMQTLLHQTLRIPYDKIKRIEAIADDPGFRGCTRSHLKALKEGFRTNIQYLCLMEDDLMLVDNVTADLFHQTVQKGWDTCQGDFDVMYLAMTPIKLEPVNTVSRLHRVRQALAMPALIINVRYFEKLQTIYETALKTKKPHDLVTQLYQPTDVWYGYYPPLMRQRPGYSDIEKRNTDYKHLEIDGKMLTIRR